VFLVNLAGTPLADPAFGAGAAAFSTVLQTRGVAGHPDFGGAGPTTLLQLDTDAVWTTLVPDDTTDFTAAADGVVGSAATLADGEAIYLLGATLCPWDLDGDDIVGITDFLDLLAQWGSDPGGPPDFDGDGTVGITDFLELLANWGDCP